MTMLDERAQDLGLSEAAEQPQIAPDPAETPPTEPEDDAAGPVLRPLLVAALVSSAAGFMTGGIFGEWIARGIGVAGALLGVGWGYLAVRSKRPTVIQATLLPVAFGVGLLTMLATSNGGSQIFSLMGDAVSSGRLLRPPVPFDPGWRPILIMMMALLGFVTATLSAGMRRPQLAILVAVPILGLTAISQPAEGEFIGGVGGFLPILLALGLMFGGDGRVSELGTAFELKRALRSAPLLAGGLALIVLLAQTDFLFPKPAYNPAEKPQKPKSIPLGEVRDRVLFEIEGDITGPWKTGVLDFYDGEAWRLPPFDEERLEEIPSSGIVDDTRVGDTTVKFTIRDLGTSSVMPGVIAPTKVTFSKDVDALYDPRTNALRMRTGRVPADLSFTMEMPKYPEGDKLRTARPPRRISEDLTYMPKAPAAVQQLLSAAPENPWERLEYVRSALNKVVIAVGAGEPSKDVPPSKVADLLVGSHEGSPFEIVAAEAMLARWAGIPARIGYGFDGVNDEDGTLTVRPKNGANWLEVNFEGYGWLPLVGTPPKAKSSLDTDENTKFDPTIEPSDDVAVELYVPIELESLRLLYQRIRSVIASVAPFALALGALYLAAPAIRRWLRRRRRRAWAHARGLRHEIAVEYAELRDAATDLNVGHPSETPLEYTLRVVDDAQHAELAWLVTRALYGDLAFELTDDDVQRATDMSASLRRRMSRAQPFQSRVLAVLSRASLKTPYTTEVPNVRAIRLRRPRRPAAARGRRRPMTRRQRLASRARGIRLRGRGRS